MGHGGSPCSTWWSCAMLAHNKECAKRPSVQWVWVQSSLPLSISLHCQTSHSSSVSASCICLSASLCWQSLASSLSIILVSHLCLALSLQCTSLASLWSAIHVHGSMVHWNYATVKFINFLSHCWIWIHMQNMYSTINGQPPLSWPQSVYSALISAQGIANSAQGI